MAEDIAKRETIDDLTPATPDGHVWERLRGESRAVFGYFAAYRDMGRDRSIRKLADELGKNSGTIFPLSAKYRWQERIDAYEDYLDQRDREVRESERERVNRENVVVFRRMQVIVGKRLIGDHSDPRNPVAAIDPNELDPADLARWQDLIWRGLRAATGQPTDYVAGKFQISGEDMSKVVQMLYEATLPIVPEERRPRLASIWQAVLGGADA